jgi:hypothetical protein
MTVNICSEHLGTMVQAEYRAPHMSETVSVNG